MEPPASAGGSSFLPMKRPRVSLLLALLAIWPASSRAGFDDVPLHHAADPGAAVVTEGNLLASERFWPYQVALIRAWQAPGRERPLDPGVLGVLIRVEAGGLARIDFGREGLYEVPIGATDLLARANQVRQGDLHKMAPNLVLAIGPRLLDSASTPLRALGLSAASEPKGFLCVFADPGTPAFADLAAALAPLRGRHGVLTVLFPQGEHPDHELGEQLRSLGWTVPFMQDGLAEAYTRTLVPGGTPLPALTLATREGRVLFQVGWRADAVPELSSALEEGFGGPSD
jgi:hypothetical protein